MEYAELEKYGEKEADFLMNKFAKMEDDIDDSCTDNFRVCKIGNAAEEELYEDHKSSGCCGEEDREVTHPETGKQFKIGCNYGH